MINPFRKTKEEIVNVLGRKEIVLMAGPCAIESVGQMEAILCALRGAPVGVFRGSAYKPRTSPHSFQGLGLEGLKIHKQMKEKYGILIETEVVDPRDVMIVAEHVDILRIGARNMQNFSLLKEVALCKRPVILKRGFSATIEEWLLSAEYILSQGNADVIMCERGIRTFEPLTRATLDLSSVPLVKKRTNLPVIVDPSHAAGRREIIPELCRAAIAVGADGLLVEVHHDPKNAKCDGAQALLPEEFVTLCGDLERIALAIGRALWI